MSIVRLAPTTSLPPKNGNCNDGGFFRAELDSAKLPAFGAPVAQLDRALVYETKGRRFEPCRARFVPGTAAIYLFFLWSAPLAGSGTPLVPVGPEVRVQLGKVQVIATSEPDETRWGYHQYPALFRLPQGRIGLGFSHNADATEAVGHASPMYVSADEGRSWKRVYNHVAGYKPHPAVAEISPGEFLSISPVVAFNLKATGLSLPPPVGYLGDEKGISLHRYEESPKEIQDFMRELPAYRWTPDLPAWKPETVIYDTRGRLIWKHTKSHLVGRTRIEHAPARLGDELFYGDYQGTYTAGDDTIPRHWPATCMVSRDNGRTWTRRGTIAVDPTGDSYMTEPMIAVASDGRLACAIRGSAHYTDYTKGHRLVITFSSDRGRTWEPVRPLHKFGVFPCLLLLENGIMACSFGRHGVHMKFSADGTGRTWSKPTTLIPMGTSGDRNTCGYTSVLAVGPDEFLIAYSHFKHQDRQGRQQKAILLRRVRVSR